jgi:PAS domain S-box-containing protein
VFRTGLIWLSEARLRPLALGSAPAWLWSVDAARIIWANPTGAAIFGAATPAALSARRFDSGQPAAAQVARLAEMLTADAAARIERLRGFGAGLGRALTCACARIILADGTAAILIAATERAGPDLPLGERVRRLLAGCDQPVAAFGTNGEWLAASPEGAWPPANTPSLAALGLAALADEARRSGHAEGHIASGPIALDRLDSDGALILIATVGQSAETANPKMETHAEVPPSTIPTEMLAPAMESQPTGESMPTAASAPPAPSLLPSSRQQAVSLPPTERRHPLRFVWQMDAEGRFSIGSDEFIELIGPQTAAKLGQPWDNLAATLDLDPEDHVARAINTRDTWSGLSAAWPVDGSDERLAVELSGLPVFDRDRNFRGYRGFGVCRDLARIDALVKRRHAAAGRAAETPSLPTEPPATLAIGNDAGADEAAAADSVENSPQFAAGVQAEATAPSLTAVERRAFRELARRLTERLSDTTADDTSDDTAGQVHASSSGSDPTLSDLADAAKIKASEAPPPVSGVEFGQERPLSRSIEQSHVAAQRETRSVLDRLPTGVLIYRLEHLLYANRAFLDWTGHHDLTSLMEMGGINSLLIEPKGDGAGGPIFIVASEHGERPPVEGQLLSVQWEGEEAHALVLMHRGGNSGPEPSAPATFDEEQRERERRELRLILDTAADGVLVLNADGSIRSANRSAQALFGEEEAALVGRPFTGLFAADSAGTAADYLAELRDDVASVLNTGRELMVRQPQGGQISLFVTLGRLGEGGRICALIRDITQKRQVEAELAQARRRAAQAPSGKLDFLAKVSHEIRTPLNSIIGFSEVMMQERFGPIGNDRYRDYLRNISASGADLLSLIDELLDLCRIEAGKNELSFSGISLNELVQECVEVMQAAANRGRVIIRTSLSPKLPQVTADASSVRQIVLNLLSHSLGFTVAGGQVIVSTLLNEAGEVSLHVRDTGAGMSAQEIATALDPFRQLATSTRFGSGHGGLGLPLAKALAEANRATFHISSRSQAGTLVEVRFPKAAAMVG